MKTIFRHRSLFLFGGALLAAFASFWTDPDANGLSTLLGGPHYQLPWRAYP